MLSCLSSWVLLRSLTFPLYFSISSTFPSLVLPPLRLLSARPPLRFSLPFSCHSVPPPPPHCCDTLLPLLKLFFFPLLPLSVCCECCLFLFRSSSLPPFLSLVKSAACVSAQQWEGLIHGDLKCNCGTKNPMTFFKAGCFKIRNVVFVCGHRASDDRWLVQMCLDHLACCLVDDS